MTTQPSFLRGALGLIAVAATLSGLMALSACPPSRVNSDDDDATSDDDDSTEDLGVSCPEDDPWEPNNSIDDGFRLGGGEDDAYRILCPGDPDVFLGNLDIWTSIDFTVRTDDPEAIEVEWLTEQVGTVTTTSTGLSFSLTHPQQCNDEEQPLPDDVLYAISLAVETDAAPIVYDTTSLDELPCGDE